MIDLKGFIKTHFPLPVIIGMAAGVIGGYLYYYFIGCSSGSCSITSNPYSTMAWGLILGWLIGDMFKKKPIIKKDQQNSN